MSQPTHSLSHRVLQFHIDEWSTSERKNDMRRSLKIYLPEDLYLRAKDSARNSKMSLSSFISNSIAATLSDEPATVEFVNDENPDLCHVLLRGEAAITLRKRARKLGISPTSFVRDAVLFQNMTIITIDHSIGRALLMAFDDYDMDLKYLINCLKNCVDEQEAMLVYRSAESDTRELADLVVKYQKKISKEISQLEDSIKERITNGN